MNLSDLWLLSSIGGWLSIVLLLLLVLLFLAPLFIWSHLAYLNREFRRFRCDFNQAVTRLEKSGVRKVLRCPDCHREIRDAAAGQKIQCSCGAELTIEDAA